MIKRVKNIFELNSGEKMSTEKLGNLIYSQPKKEREVVRVMNK